MIVNLYAVHDRLSGTYANPFTQDERTAGRTFKWMKEEADKKDREDKEVCILGNYDTETGIITAQQPLAVFDLDKEAKE